MTDNFARQTERRVKVTATDDGTGYRVKIDGGPVYEGGLLNIGGRAAALDPGSTLELGGGETDVIIRGRDDSRASDGTLLVIGFTAEAIL